MPIVVCALCRWFFDTDGGRRASNIDGSAAIFLSSTPEAFRCRYNASTSCRFRRHFRFFRWSYFFPRDYSNPAFQHNVSMYVRHWHSRLVKVQVFLCHFICVMNRPGPSNGGLCLNFKRLIAHHHSDLVGPNFISQPRCFMTRLHGEHRRVRDR